MSVAERLSALETRLDDVEALLATLSLSARQGTRTKRICEWCGAALEGKKPGARYCSPAHRVAAWKARRAA